MMLALRLGRTLEELCASMSSAEFSLWASAYKDDQWGEMWEDWRMGVVASTIANFAGKTLPKGAQGTTAKDFMPKFGNQEEETVSSPDPFTFFSQMNNQQTT